MFILLLIIVFNLLLLFRIFHYLTILDLIMVLRIWSNLKMHIVLMEILIIDLCLNVLIKL